MRNQLKRLLRWAFNHTGCDLVALDHRHHAHCSTDPRKITMEIVCGTCREQIGPIVPMRSMTKAVQYDSSHLPDCSCKETL